MCLFRANIDMTGRRRQIPPPCMEEVGAMAAALAAAGVAPPLIAAVDRALDGMRAKARSLDADLLAVGQALLEDIGAVEAAVIGLKNTAVAR